MLGLLQGTSALERWRPGALFLAALVVLVSSGCAQPQGATANREAQEQPEPKSYSPQQVRALYQRGLKARERQVYSLALSYFNQASDAGYGPASVAAGKMLGGDYPEIVQNFTRSAQLYQRAIAQGAGYDAELPLGFLYLKGLGVAQNQAEAERWFRRGALTVVRLQGVVKVGEAEPTVEPGAEPAPESGT